MHAENRPSYIGFDVAARQTLVSPPTAIIAGETGSCKVQNRRIHNGAPVESHYRSRDHRCRVAHVTQPSVRLSYHAVDAHHRVTCQIVAKPCARNGTHPSKLFTGKTLRRSVIDFFDPQIPSDLPGIMSSPTDTSDQCLESYSLRVNETFGTKSCINLGDVLKIIIYLKATVSLNLL